MLWWLNQLDTIILFTSLYIKLPCMLNKSLNNLTLCLPFRYVSNYLYKTWNMKNYFKIPDFQLIKWGVSKSKKICYCFCFHLHFLLLKFIVWTIIHNLRSVVYTIFFSKFHSMNLWCEENPKYIVLWCMMCRLIAKLLIHFSWIHNLR